MLYNALTPRTTALVAGAFLLVCLLIGVLSHTVQAHNQQAALKMMDWQRDREMGIPDTGVAFDATPEEKDEAKTVMLEQRLTQQRAASDSAR